jgi:hypothetical protein
MADLGAMHRASRQRVGDLVADVDPDRAVPATPSWTVHDVLAHLAGLAEAAALTWSADPGPYLDAWFLFGPRHEPLGEAAW